MYAHVLLCMHLYLHAHTSFIFLFPSCVEKWLKGSGGKCPQCNAKAKRADIRLIYAKTISVVDTTERDRALKVNLY